MTVCETSFPVTVPCFPRIRYWNSSIEQTSTSIFNVSKVN